MSTFTVRIWIGPTTGQTSEPIDAVVDTGSTFTVIPAALLDALGIQRTGHASFRLADGNRMESDTGRALLRVEGIDDREEVTRVEFGGPGEPTLLGAVTLEELLLGVDPIAKELVPVDALRYGR